jgi:ribosomal protein S18 acetylase RimI-like enzyme
MASNPSPPTDSPPSLVIKLRTATVNDAPAIALLGSTVFATTFGYSMSHADLNAYLQEAYCIPAILSDLSSPLKTLVVAELPNPRGVMEVAGFTQLTRDSHVHEPCIACADRPVELQRLYVSASHHGLGIGKLLIQEMERRAREEGFGTMWLGVWEENLKAKGVYEKMGYRRVGEHDFKMGECVQTDLILIKTL